MTDCCEEILELFTPSFPPKSFFEKISLIDNIDRKYLNGRMTIDEILEVASEL
jgi:hypothetical protein